MDTRAHKKHHYPPNRLKTAFLVLKLAFFALGFISFIKFGVPSLQHLLFQTVPSLWLSFSSWLTPHFLYIVLNCIILTIAVTSSLHQKPKPEGDPYAIHDENPDSSRHHHLVKDQHPPLPEISYHRFQHHHEPHTHTHIHTSTVFHDEIENPNSYALVPGESPFMSKTPTKVEDDDEDCNCIARSNWSTSTSSCMTSVEDKPLASARFTHKKSSKASPDTKTSPLSRVSRPKKGETLEYTWKTITDGRHPPLARHLRKSETWEMTPKTPVNAELSSSSPVLRKSQTVRQRHVEDSPASSASASPARHSMKRDPSLSQDELNRRVEAFISKFNNEIRLQRQNSFKSYTDMINRI